MRVLELKIPPVVVGAILAALMWLVSRIAPTFGFQPPARSVVAAGLAFAGFATALAGMASFRRAKTTVNPLTPGSASTLVVSGIYRLTRNPMYLGMLLVLLGWAVLQANALAFLLLPVFVAYMNLFQIMPEEKALAGVFGREFTTYQSKVRRWL